MELLIVASVMTVLLGMVAAVTHTLYRAQRSTRAEMTSRRVLTRLALQFRKDGHAAETAEIGAADGGRRGSQLTLFLGSQRRVRYKFIGDSGEIERVLLDGESAVARDNFALPSDASAAFEPAGQPVSRLIVLKVTQLVCGEPGAGERTLRIETAVGLDQRHLGAQRARDIR
jgi:hypothetical protein